MKTTSSKFLLKGIAVIAVCLITACNQKKETITNVVAAKKTEVVKPIVAPLFSKANVAFDSFTINPVSSTTITAASGTKIIIAANSLVDSAGKPITETCELKYREFMSPSEIMASGIPMTFNDKSASISKPFISAGMFELKAKVASGNVVSIDNSNPIKVELVSNNNDNGFSNFYLNDKTGEWVYSGEELKTNNTDKIKLNKQIKKLKEATAFMGKDYFVLNSSGLLDVYFNNDYEKIAPYYENKNKPLPKKMLKYGITSKNISCYNSVKINRYELPAGMVIWENINHIKFPSWTENKHGDLKLVSDHIYELTISDGKKKPTFFKAQIKAVMSIKSMFNYEPEYWTKNFNEAIKEIKKQEETLATMNDVFRTLEVNAFGIYNCDKFYQNTEMFEVNASIIIPASKSGFKPEKIFYVSKRDKVFINYFFSNAIKLTLCNDNSASLYTVLEGDVLATVSATDLIKYNKQNNANSTISLQFKPLGKINTVEDIKKQIGI